MAPWWGILALGVAGGFLNALLAGTNRIHMPTWVRASRDFDLGFLGNIIVGVGAAFLSYWLLASRPAGEQLGLALASGIGGASVITNFVQKAEISLISQERDALGRATKDLAAK